MSMYDELRRRLGGGKRPDSIERLIREAELRRLERCVRELVSAQRSAHDALVALLDAQNETAASVRRLEARIVDVETAVYDRGGVRA